MLEYRYKYGWRIAFHKNGKGYNLYNVTEITGVAFRQKREKKPPRTSYKLAECVGKFK
jgi:hypothetical protein